MEGSLGEWMKVLHAWSTEAACQIIVVDGPTCSAPAYNDFIVYEGIQEERQLLCLPAGIIRIT